MLHHVRAKSRKTCTCNYIIEGKETYIFPKLLNVISFLKNIQTVLLITHHIRTKIYILLHIKISHFLDYFDIKTYSSLHTFPMMLPTSCKKKTKNTSLIKKLTFIY